MQGLENRRSSVPPVDAVIWLLRYIECLISGDDGMCRQLLNGVPRGCFRSHTSGLTDEKVALLRHAHNVLLNAGGLRLSAANLRDLLLLCLPENVHLPYVVSCVNNVTNEETGCSWFVPVTIDMTEFKSCLDVSSSLRQNVWSKYRVFVMPTAPKQNDFTPEQRMTTNNNNITQNDMSTTTLHNALRTLQYTKEMMAEALRDDFSAREFHRSKDQILEGLMDLLLRFAREWTSVRTSPSLMQRVESSLWTTPNYR